MKAVRVHTPGGPEVLTYEDVPAPTPKAGEAVVKIDAAGLNYIDVYFRTGQYKAELPVTLGMEAGGTVTAVGPGVTEVKPGDKVAYTGVPGAYAELAAVPAQRLVVLLAGVATRQGAAAMLQGMTAQYLACSTWPLKSGDTCLVHAAAGGVGLLLCQIARMRGARVLGTVSTEDEAGLRGGGEAAHGRQGRAGRLRLGRQDDVRQGVQLPGAARDDGALRSVERARRYVRPPGPEPEGLRPPHAPQPLPPHRDAGRPARARRRGARLDPRRQAQAPDRVRVPAEGRGRGAPGPRGGPDDGQGAAEA